MSATATPLPHAIPTAETAAPVHRRHWKDAAAPFRAPQTRRSVLQLATTLLPLATLLGLMYAALGVSYGLVLALAPLAAGFLLRSFIIMHDCSHGSFFPSRRANEITGFLTGVLTFTPFAQWRRDHALHHASSGDLERRGHGDIDTLTIDEYLARDWRGRLKYRLYRSPFVLFGLGPLYLLFSQRWRPRSTATRDKQVNSVLWTNVAIAALLATFWWLIGLEALVLVYLPVFYLAAVGGIWLFYVQHQFEETYWEEHAAWDYETAALYGSSYYRLPWVLEWISGSIGLHHVHHLDPRIPNYNLRACHDATPEFRDVPVLTVRASLRAMSLKLWDPEQRRLVGFGAARDVQRRRAIVPAH